MRQLAEHISTTSLVANVTLPPKPEPDAETITYINLNDLLLPISTAAFDMNESERALFDAIVSSSVPRAEKEKLLSAANDISPSIPNSTYHARYKNQHKV